MATPKLDRIIDQFTNLIGEPATYSGTTLQDGDVLTVSQVEAYMAKAMFKLFSQYWKLASQAGTPKDQAKIFLGIFPELIKTASVTVSSSVYTIASPNLDLFLLFGASENVSDAYIRILDASMHTIIKSSLYTQYTPSASDRIAIYKEGAIRLYPDIATLEIDIDFIKKPVLPTTGGILEQDGSYDSPFNEIWEPEIAEIADNIYRQERQIK